MGVELLHNGGDKAGTVPLEGRRYVGRKRASGKLGTRGSAGVGTKG
jgi:hypothetical protein